MNVADTPDIAILYYSHGVMFVYTPIEHSNCKFKRVTFSL